MQQIFAEMTAACSALISWMIPTTWPPLPFVNDSASLLRRCCHLRLLISSLWEQSACVRPETRSPIPWRFVVRSA